MTFAVRGIPQHTFREMRFADLLFVTWRHRIPCFIEDGPQELRHFWKAHHDERGFASMHTCHVTSGTLVGGASLVRQFAP